MKPCETNERASCRRLISVLTNRSVLTRNIIRVENSTGKIASREGISRKRQRRKCASDRVMRNRRNEFQTRTKIESSVDIQPGRMRLYLNWKPERSLITPRDNLRVGKTHTASSVCPYLPSSISIYYS